METKVPGGRLGRMTRLAALGLKTGAGAMLRKGDDNGKAAAGRATEVLGTMRGLAAKVGQMASYVDGLVPESKRASHHADLCGKPRRGDQGDGPRGSQAPRRRVLRHAERDALHERLQFGFYSVLARLDVEVDYAKVESELLPIRT